MKLSEAIREGAKLGPQHFGWYFGPNQASCALGAAIRAACDGKSIALVRVFPQVCLPACACHPDMFCHIVYLNDEALVSREDIASWVEALELADEATEKALREQPAELVSA